MFENKNNKGIKSVWFKVPNGYCWFGGVPSLNGKCVYCGYETKYHKKIDDDEQNLTQKITWTVR